MVGSMFAAVAGLKAHQTKLDVIGNNIANVNTWGFKSQLANIEDTVYRNRRSSTGNRGNNGGGVNASQIGYGSNVNYISVNYTTGNWNPTGWGGDCMINGSGFFAVTKNLANAKGIVRPGGLIGSEEAIAGVVGSINADGSVGSADVAITSGDGIQLSRVCMLGIDDEGYLVDQNGYYVLNFQGRAMQVRQSGTVETQKTVNQGELQYTDRGNDVVTRKEAKEGDGIYSDGSNCYKDGVTGKQVEKELDLDGKGPKTYKEFIGDNKIPVYQIADGSDTTFYTSKGIPYSVTGTAPTPNMAYTVQVGTETVSVEPYTGTYYQKDNGDIYNGDTSELDPIMVETTVMGPFTYDSITIQVDGTITAVVKSPALCAGKVETLGQLGVASVENVQGLEHDQGYYYDIAANAGDVTVNQTTVATGDILGGYLEMSNVDLSTEITGLITTQRGYQANTKIITVTDEMLETLVNMKR